MGLGPTLMGRGTPPSASLQRSVCGCVDARGRRFTMETSPTDGVIGQRLENYDIERLRGAGGMANVYQARDTLHGREVAIKALSPAFLTDPGYVERFRREAHRIAALEHPSIVPMLQFIEKGAGLYVVMPLY